MSTDDFFSQIPSSSGDYEPITDLSIALNDLLVICEVKRNTNDCKWQLFQQAEKAVQNIDAGIKMNDSIVKPVDLNWKKLVEIAMHIHHFHLSTGRPNRFLNDFLNMIRQHDYNWMPINPLSEVGSDNQYALNARLNLALTQSSSETLGVGGRAGFSVSLGWANEVLFGFSKTGNESVFWAAIFPGNTKGQGWPLFHNEQGPIFRDKIVVNGIELSIEKKVHLKFSHFQKYFAELTFDESVCEKPIMTRRNFVNVSGRKKREGNDWKQIQDFFDSHFREDYDWRSKFDGHLDWPGLLKSGKGYFDLSFGYELSVQVPLKVLQELDRRIDDVTAFAQFLDDINAQFSTVLIQE